MIDKDQKINGNLAGSAVTMNIALRRLSEYARYPEKLLFHEAVRWGSKNPVTTLGIAAETGSIAVGKSADIALFDDGFEVKMTLLKGRVLFDALGTVR